MGKALCRRFAAEGAKAIVVADVNIAAATTLAGDIGGLAVETDVSQEPSLVRLVGQVTDKYGVIDLFCSNAGIAISGGPDVPNADWQQIWETNVMAHVYAARAVLPEMLACSRGYLLQTISAAGLLTHIAAAPYAVTKHAALAFAEWLAIAYGDRGIKVSALCPQGVRTDMLLNAQPGRVSFLLHNALEPEEVAEHVIGGLADERFLILPHPEVAEHFRHKADDYDRWIRGMRRMQATIQAASAEDDG